MLEMNQINTFYGISHILFDITLSIREGEIIYYLGRNGTGKTTTIRSIMGLNTPSSGSIKFKGEEMVGKKAYEIALRGIGYLPSGRRIFPDLTVRENLGIAIKPSTSGNRPWTIKRAYDLFPPLAVLDKRMGGHLSGGELQMLAIGRALMGNPELILMDEPTEGLSPLMVKTLGEKIIELKEEGVTIFLTEQNIRFALKLASRGYIVDDGRIKYKGTVEELEKNAEVKTQYLAL